VAEFKVLQVCSASRLIYGAAHSLMTLADAQRAAGKNVEFLTFKGKQFGSEVRARGFVAHEVRVRAKVDLLAILRMRKLMLAAHYGIVHTHLSTSSVNGTLAARLAKVPCVATVHGMSGKLSFVAANHLIGVSDQVKIHLVQQGLLPANISVVYNGLPIVPQLERAEARRILGIPGQAMVLGTVARVTAMKGIDDAIRALPAIAREIPEILYVVVGDGDALDACRELAIELGVADRVSFVGYQNNVQPYLAAMDVFLFPSHKEAMGIALAEAMAAGLPSIASNIDGIPEVLTPETGLLVPAKAPEHIAVAALQLLRNEEGRRRKGEAARLRAEKVFSAEAMEQSTDWVYRGMLGMDLPVPTEKGVSSRAEHENG
jgi:glycosyltransferase involved in cell wall biosynthesis